VRWVAVDDLGRYETTDGLADMIHRAVRLVRAMSSQPGGTF